MLASYLNLFRMSEATPNKNTETLLRATLEELRRTLIDQTRRNRLLNFRHPSRGQFVRLVGPAPERILAHLVDAGISSFLPLPDPNDPADERTTEFQAALTRARQLDPRYQEATAEIDPDDPAALGKEHKAERSLRDRLRAELGMPPRSRRAEIDPKEWARQHGIDPSYDLPLEPPPASKENGSRLQTILFPDLLRARLTALSRTAGATERETGVKTLHLALGFLEWFEDDDSDEPYVSPLLLLPVRLDRKRIRGKEEQILVSADDPNPKTNLSLELRLSELGLSLPKYDPNARQPVEAYFAAVATLAKPRNRWRLRRFATLARFSFARIAVYDDLDPAHWETIGEPSLHPLISPLLQPGGEGLIADAPEIHDADNPEIRKLVPVLIHDADSSQVSAIADAMCGQSLVIEGPPGTGKSQTIANLIANLLYCGKTVLFVSEKMAALEVVKSRLDAVNLGAFCLTLHAAGAAPAAVIEKLSERAGFGTENTPPGSDETAHHRAVVKRHLEVMHAKVGPRGETVHTLVGMMADLAFRLPDLPRLLRPKAAVVPQDLTVELITSAREKLAALEHLASAPDAPTDYYAGSPFHSLERTDLFPDEQEALIDALSNTARALEALDQSATALSQCCGLPEPATTSVLEEWAKSALALPNLGVPIERELLRRAATKTGRAALANFAELLTRRGEAQAILQRSGIADPAHLAAGTLGEFARRATSLGLSHVRAEDIALRARSESEELHECTLHGKTVVALTALLSIGSDPDVSTLLCAVAASRLAAEADPEWLTHRRAGFAQQAAALHGLAVEAGRLAREEERIGGQLALQDATSADFRAAAQALRNGHALGFLSADFRRARRLFLHRWRDIRPPGRPASNATLLEDAAALIEALEALRTNSVVVSVHGAQWKPDPTALRHASLAAAWQQRVEDLAGTNSINGTAISERIILLHPSEFKRLAAVARAAGELDRWLQKLRPHSSVRWSALRSELAERTRALAMFAIETAEVGLALDAPLSALGELEHAHATWREACAALAAYSESPHSFGPTWTAPQIGEALSFAEAAADSFPQAAERLLIEGWPDQSVRSLRQAAEAFNQSLARLREVAEPLKTYGLSSLAQQVTETPSKQTIIKVRDFLAHQESLPSFLNYARVSRACRADPLAKIVLSAYEAADRSPAHTAAALRWLVAWTLVRRHAEDNRDVFSRSGRQLDASRHGFAIADRANLERDLRTVRAQALRRKPPPGSNLGHRAEWTDAALLNNEFAKSKRHIPVRDLLGRAGKAVQALTPCMMMSPLTVAQYLPPGKIFFDAVIMDEASQIAPSHAIGALLRSKQAIIVGDSQQLPPTDFFDRSSNETADAEAIAEDDEDQATIAPDDKITAKSILDLARSGLPAKARRLLWHYRSRHESLIAFSNRAFYPDSHGNGSLIVFPSAEPVGEMLGIELVRVQGIRQNRQNSAEARAVAVAAAQFAHTHPDRSLGIVTMNIPQRILIESELERLASCDPGWERYQDSWNERLEPCFVKNLENVQGDERDAIFISLGWAPTVEGVFHQRFYPITREFDGPRRLNVLFTRARRKILLFASFAPEQIRIDEKAPRGTKVLRDYLLFARDGKLPLHGIPENQAESPFEASVAAALRSRGHDVAMQVGVGGYRIDLAVRDAADPARYIVGVECDGATYHRARSARDRDRLREEILRSLGWTHLVRVWSTDWFHDPVGQTARLEAEIARASEAARGRPYAPLRFIDPGEILTTPAACPQSADFFAEPAVSAALSQSNMSPAETAAAAEQTDTGSSAEEDPSRAPDLTTALERFRESVIFRDFPGSEPDRCILRREMISYFVDRHLDDKDDWFEKVPEWLRSRTDARQAKRYLDEICELVSRFPAP